LKYREIDLNLLPEANKQNGEILKKEIYANKRFCNHQSFSFVSLSVLYLSIRRKLKKVTTVFSEQKTTISQSENCPYPFSLIRLPGKQTKGVKFHRFTPFSM